MSYPCCFSVGPFGWATCLHCGAAFTSRENITPSAAGVIKGAAASSRPSVPTRTAVAARAIAFQGRASLKPKRGELWTQIRKSYNWRKAWMQVTAEKRQEYASVGYCHYLIGKGRVPPWTISQGYLAPPKELLGIMAEQNGHDPKFVFAIIACVDYLEDHPQMTPKGWDNASRAGRSRIEEFQWTVFRDVLGTPEPDIGNLNARTSVSSTVISPTHLRPSRLK